MVLRFNFRIRNGEERPDPSPALETAYRCAYAGCWETPSVRRGRCSWGQSLGARIAAELVSRGADAGGVRSAGLVFPGFPAHRGAGSTPNEPLRHVAVPSLS